MIRKSNQAISDGKVGAFRESNLGPLAPEARIIPLDQMPNVLLNVMPKIFRVLSFLFNFCSLQFLWFTYLSLFFLSSIIQLWFSCRLCQKNEFKFICCIRKKQFFWKAVLKWVNKLKNSCEIGAFRESNSGPLAPEARIIPLDQTPAVVGVYRF